MAKPRPKTAIRRGASAWELLHERELRGVVESELKRERELRHQLEIRVTRDSALILQLVNQVKYQDLEAKRLDKLQSIIVMLDRLDTMLAGEDTNPGLLARIADSLGVERPEIEQAR